jgi:heterogeneous nuclear ribonucleoprotein M
MLGVLAGVNKVYGGVVRNESGQILAHLVNASTPSSILSAFTSPLNTLLSGVNTYQLHHIGADVGRVSAEVGRVGAEVGRVGAEVGRVGAEVGRVGAEVGRVGAEVGRVGAEVGRVGAEVGHMGANVTQLLQLAQASMLLSGLTLAVSSAGFLFLSNKINKIDQKLQQVASDVKYIKSFLELQERSRLIAALKVIRELNKVDDSSARLQMLISSRQTIGEIHEKYKMLLTDSSNEYSFMAAEEYFTITAIGHSLCSAELDMYTIGN